mmetsp:Transcript_58439/g.127878  ORF Transcript_58439/g.127878 Transcript_58439/m.127878 type:complete len:467 (-) Transcript_58439:200-1600(-)
MSVLHFSRHRLPFANVIHIDLIVLVFALPDQVGRYHHGFQLVDLLKLLGFGKSGACHATQLVKEAEETLVGYASQGNGLGLNLHILFRFNGLVETITPAASLHDATGELVHDHDFTTFHDVGLVFDVELFRIQCVGNEREPRVLRIKKVVLSQKFLSGFHTTLDEDALPLFLINGVVHLLLQGSHHFLCHLVFGGCILGDARDDQRSSGLVNKDGVHLIHHCEVEGRLLTQCQLRGRWRHLVAQVVETQLTVCHVGDVTPVGLLLLVRWHSVLHHPHRHPQKAQGLTDPLRITARQVVVHRDHVDALSAERIEEGSQDRHQGLTLTGAHLSNVALMESNTSHHLHIKVSQAQDSSGSLAHQRKGFGQQLLQSRAALGSLLQICRQGTEVVVGFRLHGLLQRIDGLNLRLVALLSLLLWRLIERVQLFHVAEEFPCDLRQALLALRAPPPSAVLRKATQAAGRHGAH